MAAVELLEQHDPRELVRQRHLPDRQAEVDLVDLEPVRPADHEAEVTATLAPLFQERTESERVHVLAIAVKQRQERAIGDPSPDLLVLAHLHQLQPRVAREQLLVVLHVVGKGWAQPADCNDEDPHVEINVEDRARPACIRDRLRPSTVDGTCQGRAGSKPNRKLGYLWRMASLSRRPPAGKASRATQIVLLIAGSVAVLLLVILIVSTSGATRRPTDRRGRPKVSANPLHGMHLYVDPQNRAALQVAAWQATGDTADATPLERIATQPTAYWLAAGNNPTPVVAALMQRAAGAHSVAELVLYYIPGRDCRSYSSGGAPSGADYTAWVRAVATGIGRHTAIVILEPDAIDQAAAGCSSHQDAVAHYQLLDDAVTILKANPAARVYLDAGNAGWLHPGQIAGPLRLAGIGRADGFALNVANFETTAASIAYGRRLSALVGGRHFIIDTSRNGNGPPATHAGIARWCNPSGRAIGTAPTTDTGNSLVDALLWIKYPGTSDGDCRAGEPPAGAWWPAYALALARGTSTATSG